MSTTQMNPAANLLQPSRPTTATTASSPSAASTSYFNPPFENNNNNNNNSNVRSTTTTNIITAGNGTDQQDLSSLKGECAMGPIPNLLATFCKGGSPVPGTVRIRVENTVFYCHRELLMLASPYFESLLGGDWKENQKNQRSEKSLSKSTVQPQSDDGTPSQASDQCQENDTAHSSIPNDLDPHFNRMSLLGDEGLINTRSCTRTDTDAEEDHQPLPMTQVSLENGQGSKTMISPNYKPLRSVDDGPSNTICYPSVSDLSRPPTTYSYDERDEDDDDEDDEDDEDDLEEEDGTIVCRLRLQEESASRFQDLLCHLYPSLECLVQWGNVGDLCRMASKFDLPSLRRDCIAFLLPSAAGNPIMGMKIAEDNNIPELYKEASRYTLDNYQHWPLEELGILSETTLLKLERRRSWFLERLLKLGLVQTSRDYTCHSACMDPSTCAKLVDEKWRSAWSSSFRSGTPQPSIIYRSLRSLEPSLSSPALHLPFTACQTHARLYVADLFDRMFGLSITSARNWGALTVGGTSSSTAGGGGAGGGGGVGGGSGRTFGPSADGIATKNSSARYFLFIEMGDDRVLHQHHQHQHQHHPSSSVNRSHNDRKFG